MTKTVSIVIPVYNEQDNITDCLKTIEKQTVAPLEVIVVDNNCTDRTVELASKFPFVKVIVEPQQGRGWARTTGFNAAKGDVIGRIDADSRLSADWVARITKRFSEDEMLMGLTGMATTSFIPGVQRIRTSLFTRSYYWFVHSRFHTITMWGANMAVRRRAWLEIANEVCNDDHRVHEDQDVSLCIAARGGKLVQDNSLRITTSGQTYRYLPKVLQYSRLFAGTMKRHKANGNLRSNKLPRLGFWTTFPGLIWTYLLGCLFFVFIIVMFPFDYAMVHLLKRHDWVD